MPSTIVLLQLAAIVVLLASTLETFRERPWWPQPVGRSPDRPPPRGSSPRERRWLHLGLALLLGGNVLSLLRPGDESVWAVSVALLVAGLVLIGIGFLRGPTQAERERYRRERGAPVDDER